MAARRTFDPNAALVELGASKPVVQFDCVTDIMNRYGAAISEQWDLLRTQANESDNIQNVTGPPLPVLPEWATRPELKNQFNQMEAKLNLMKNIVGERKKEKEVEEIEKDECNSSPPPQPEKEKKKGRKAVYRFFACGCNATKKPSKKE